jgi:cardiolipin synthase
MQRRIRKYRRKLRKKFLVLSTRILNLFYKTSKPIISHGNRAQLIQSGPEAFELFLKFINESKNYIFLEYYIFRDDKHGYIIADALIKKAKEGVKIFLMYDFIGCIDTKNSFFEYLKNNGIIVISFNPIKFISNPFNWEKRNHRKLAIFDGVKAFVSGWNIGSEYFETHEEAMRDAGVLLEGPCIKGLENIFKSTFEKQSGIKINIGRTFYEPVGNDEVWIIESGPRQKFRTIYNAYRLAIMSARKRIWIENAYFVPTIRLKRALINAVKKGVDVRIVLPDKIDVPIVKYASYNHYKSLLLGGIKIYKRSKKIRSF